jgi:hypothetical protein
MMALPVSVTANTLKPVTAQCVYSSAQYFDIPFAALVGVLSQEAGRVGQYRNNTNGTRDNGPMQINTVWMDQIQKRGITELQIRNNGCLNVFVGAWILSQHFQNIENKWQAIGAYHSKTPKHNKKYQKLVRQRLLTNLNFRTVIEKANKNVHIGE